MARDFEFPEIQRGGFFDRFANALADYVFKNAYIFLVENLFKRFATVSLANASFYNEGRSSFRYLQGDARMDYFSGDALSKKGIIEVEKRLSNFFLTTEFEFKNENMSVECRVFDDCQGNYVSIRAALVGLSTNQLVVAKYVNNVLVTTYRTSTANTFAVNQRARISVRTDLTNSMLYVYVNGFLRLTVRSADWAWGMARVVFDAVDENSEARIYDLAVLQQAKEVV